MQDSLGAFVPHGDIRIEGAAKGPLARRSFAVKDLFAVAGAKTGCGNPDWLRTHEADKRNAACIDLLLAAGATLAGKVLTDEMAYSAGGENHHYGAPVNVNAAGRTTGGSSSGSAAAVAGGLVDFSLGTDTGGSVRNPAGLCGIFGIRPTHGRVGTDGLVLLAPSFDTIGWFARDPGLMASVGRVLLPGWSELAPPKRILFPEDAWALATPAVREALRPAVEALAARLGAAVEAVAFMPDGIGKCFEAFRVGQGWEIWRQHRGWIESEHPTFGPGVAERIAWTATITEAEKVEADAVREAVTHRAAALLAPGVVLALPTSPDIAPRRDAPVEALEAFRYSVLKLNGVASLAGAPQISLPLGRVEGCPAGLSLMAGRGGDEMLLGLAAAHCGAAEAGLAPVT